MNRSIRLFVLVALTIALAACSQAAGSIGDDPTSSQTAVPSNAQASPDPTSTPSETAPSAAPVPSASLTASFVATPSPAEPATDPATVLAADGIGPYLIGAEMSDLQSHGLIANVGSSFHCDDSWQHAEVVGRYAEQLALTFHHARVMNVATNSTELVTPSGARVGMQLTELQSIYGSRGRLLKGTMGNQALSVHVPNTTLGIVFFLDETNTKTIWMSAGEIQPLEELVVNGEGC